MALLPFKKLTLIAHSADEEKILTLFSRTGSVEIISSAEIEDLEKGDSSLRTERLTSDLAELSFCFDFWRAERVKIDKVLKKQKKTGEALTTYVPPKTSLLEMIRERKPDVAFDEFDRVGGDHEDILAVEKRLREISAEETELRGESTRNLSLVEQLSFYEKCDLPFDAFGGDRHVETAIGLAPADLLKAADLSDLPELCIKELDCRQRVATLFVAYPTALREQALDKLSSISFSKCTFDYPVTATEKIALLRSREEEISRHEITLAEEALSYESEIAPRMKILYDYYRVESEKASAIDASFRSASAFVLSAWVPAHLEEATESALRDAGVTYHSIFEDPLPEEKYPTLASNPAIVTPYESITNMYSAPDPREIDPNPFVAFFYFILFGLMVSDAAYGLILAIGGFGLYLLKKPRKGEGQLLLIIGMGGVSTLIWGIMFGGYFGESFFNPVLFNPMNEPLKMLILSVALGVFQILFGMGIAFVGKCKKGNSVGAIFGEGSWFVLFIGLGLLVLSGMVAGAAAVKLPAIIVLALGGVGVLVGGALGKKGVKDKLLGAFGNVYNVTGFMSDILSYCRLFGLGLATGVVGMVVNLIAGILRDLIPVVGYLLFVVVLVVGHVFNIAINTLGAYVHNSRLQYVEFFSRFYTGGGHVFKPMGSNLKYIYLQNQTTDTTMKGGKEI